MANQSTTDVTSWRTQLQGGATRCTAWAVIVALLLRAPFLTLPLHVDEGGLAVVGHAFIAASGHADGSMYGGLWLDRPPLLVLVYGLAEAAGGAVGLRMLAALGAVAIIVLAARITAALGWMRAVPVAGVVAAMLVSSPALDATFAYPEIPASAVVAGVVLCCVRELTAPRPIVRRWFVAGLLAAAALLLKQSFVDGIAVGLCAAVYVGHRTRWRLTVLPFLLGMAVPVVATLAWAATIGPGVRALGYAVFGFRLAAADALRAEPIPMSVRFGHLGMATLQACLPILVPCAVVGIVLVARRSGRGPATVLAAWLAAGCVGVLGGGYYWSHYMIQLIPGIAVLGGIALASVNRTWARRGVLVLIAATIIVTTLLAVRGGDTNLHQGKVTAVASVVRGNRHHHDRVLVLYSHANVVYYTGVRPAFPYQWSLMYVAMPKVEDQLDALLRSTQRPAWIIEWQRPQYFGLDDDGSTRRLVDRGYRTVRRVCGHDVLLRRDDRRVLRGPSGAAAPSISCDGGAG